MAELIFRKKSRTGYAPAAYGTNETAGVCTVELGHMVGPAFCRIRTAFDGTPTMALGDSVTTNRFSATGDITIGTTGLYMGLGGAGTTYAAIGRHLYTTNTQVNITYVTGGTPTVGNADWWLWAARVDPH